MDAQRFDNLAKSLAGRLSRRNALRRAGAAASATLLASAGVRAAPTAAQGQDDEPVYTVIRRYTLDGPTSAVRTALQQGYIEDACRAPGFIAYFAVEDEDGDFATVAVFRSQDDFENFATGEANWIARNLGDLLPRAGRGGLRRYLRPRGRGADVPQYLPRHGAAGHRDRWTGPDDCSRRSDRHRRTNHWPATPTPTPEPCTGEGCVCSTGTRRPCDRGFICCPTTDVPGGPGICQTRDGLLPEISVLKTEAPATRVVVRVTRVLAAAPTSVTTVGNALMRLLSPAPVKAATARPEPSHPATPVSFAAARLGHRVVQAPVRPRRRAIRPAQGQGATVRPGHRRHAIAGSFAVARPARQVVPEHARQKRSATRRVPERAAPATVGYRATATRDWSAARMESRFPAARERAWPRRNVPRRPVPARGVIVTAACKVRAMPVWSAVRTE
jgi:hypothetical protein